MDTPALAPQKPWYKTGGGLTFLIIMGVILAVALVFIALVSYYIWQIKYGGVNTVSELNKIYNPNFTLASSNPTSNVAASAEDLKASGRSYNQTAGNYKGKVTILAFIDFECPFCQEAYPTFKRVMETYAPVAKIVFKNFPVESLHPNAVTAANAAACAADQKKFWAYYDLLFTDKQLDQTSLLAEAQKLKLNMNTFQTCLGSAKHQSEINQDLTDGATLGVRGTPTYFVNTTKIEGSVDQDVWDTVILENLKK